MGATGRETCSVSFDAAGWGARLRHSSLPYVTSCTTPGQTNTRSDHRRLGDPSPDRRRRHRGDRAGGCFAARSARKADDANADAQVHRQGAGVGHGCYGGNRLPVYRGSKSRALVGWQRDGSREAVRAGGQGRSLRGFLIIASSFDCSTRLDLCSSGILLWASILMIVYKQ